MAEVNVAIEKRRCPECGKLNTVSTTGADKEFVYGICKSCNKKVKRKKR